MPDRCRDALVRERGGEAVRLRSELAFYLLLRQEAFNRRVRGERPLRRATACWLAATRREAVILIVFDLRDGGTTAAFGAAAHRSHDVGVWIFRRGRFLAKEALQEIENCSESRRLLASIGHTRSSG